METEMGDGWWKVAQIVGKVCEARVVVAYLKRGGRWASRSWIGAPLREHLDDLPAPEQATDLIERIIEQGVHFTGPLDGLGSPDKSASEAAGKQIEIGVGLAIDLGWHGHLVVWAGAPRRPDEELLGRFVSGVESVACDPLCHYRDFIEHVPALFIAFTSDGVLVHCNEYISQLGYERDEVLGRNVTLLLAPGEWERMWSELEESRQIKRFKGLVRHASGELVVMELMALAAGDNDLKEPLALAMGCDLRQESQLGHYRRLEAVVRMVSGVAHELNNPLQTVVGNAEMLAGMKLPESARRRAQRVLAGARRCQEVVDGLLKIKRKRREISQSVILEELVRGSLQSIQAEFEPLAVSTRLEVQDDLPALRGNEVDLQQAIENVMRNAFQAVAHLEQPRVLVTIACTGAMVQLTISDNGPGLSPSSLDRAFEPFFTTRGVGAGKGLGLSIALGIVQEHGGFIELQSGSDGTQALLTLPVDGR
jgi:PAS domain S-box-containing protein